MSFDQEQISPGYFNIDLNLVNEKCKLIKKAKIFEVKNGLKELWVSEQYSSASTKVKNTLWIAIFFEANKIFNYLSLLEQKTHLATGISFEGLWSGISSEVSE